tara:strand:- start:636 stop:1025 length:390 start_codon:yes stop_codon:yes gene_type:complete
MSLVKVFNEHLYDFYTELIILYPKNNELKTGRTIVETLKKFNPKKLIETWNILIVRPYEKEILGEDLDFFLYHNFSKELEYGDWGKQSNEKWMKEIKKLVQGMEEENLKKSIKYFKNLTKICNLYYGKK